MARPSYGLLPGVHGRLERYHIISKTVLGNTREHHTRPVAGLDQPVRRFQRHIDGLFHQNVLAGLGGQHAQVGMVAAGHADVHEINLIVLEQLFIVGISPAAVLIGISEGFLLHPVTHGNQPGTPGRPDTIHMGGADGAQAHDCTSYLFHIPSSPRKPIF